MTMVEGAVQTWWLYHTATGVFTGASVQGGAYARDAFLQAAGPDFSVYEGDVRYPCSRVDAASGGLVDYIPNPPAYKIDLDLYRWRWDASARRWVASPRLSKLKLDQWGVLKAARDSALYAPLPTPFGVMDHTQVSIEAIARKAQSSLALDTDVVFTRADNSTVQLTPRDMRVLLSLSVEREALVRGVAAHLRESLDAATTPGDVFSVVWPL